jgi:hypothetical protein
MKQPGTIILGLIMKTLARNSWKRHSLRRRRHLPDERQD